MCRDRWRPSNGSETGIIASGEDVGSPKAAAILAVRSIASRERVGLPTSAMILSPRSIASPESFE